jgi:hypothetical protein
VIARKNDDGPILAGMAGRLEQAEKSGVHSVADERAAQRRARLHAALARRGYLLHKLASGMWLVARAEGACTLTDFHEVEQFLRRVGGVH